jgi:hypothetical protein
LEHSIYGLKLTILELCDLLHVRASRIDELARSAHEVRGPSSESSTARLERAEERPQWRAGTPESTPAFHMLPQPAL